MGADPVRTLWVWLFGDFTPLTVREDADAYQLFVARSASLGWLSDATDPSTRGLWSMNDAATGTTPGRDLAGWFQVAIDAPTAVAPVAQMLSCVEAVTARLLDLDLHGVQVVLPAAGPDRAAHDLHRIVRRLAQTAYWIDDDLDGPTPCEITIGTRAVEPLGEALTQAGEVIEQLSHGAVAVGPAAPLVDMALAEPPGLDTRLWGGPVRQAFAMRGELTTWTLDAIAWTIELLTLACVQAGIADPLAVTILPSEPSS